MMVSVNCRLSHWHRWRRLMIWRKGMTLLMLLVMTTAGKTVYQRSDKKSLISVNIRDNVGTGEVNSFGSIDKTNMKGEPKFLVHTEYLCI